jgi:hypothetical protein
MHEVRNKTTYFFIDRSKGKTYYIGDFDKLIVFLAERIHFENRKDYVTQRFDKRDFIYDNWDFSGGDVHWVTDHKLVWEHYFDWNIEKFVSGWHYKRINYLAARPYMIIDDRGSIIDFRIWESLINAARDRMVSRSLWGTTINAKCGEKLYRYRFSPYTYRFRCGPVPGIHKLRGCGHRPHKGLLNTIRNADSIRPKARIDTDYWDNFAHSDNSWKTNTKCRYQWQKNLRG